MSTIKHKNFVSEPIRDKHITDVPGIGVNLGKRLESSGVNKAYILLGRFLFQNKDEKTFIAWLKASCGANNSQAQQTYNALKSWTEEFL
jgi:barrier-to-autointegration factor